MSSKARIKKFELDEGSNRVIRMLDRARKAGDDAVVKAAQKRESEAQTLRKRGQGLAAMQDQVLKGKIFNIFCMVQVKLKK